MAKSSDAYLASLQSNLPPGKAWARRAPVMTGLLAAFADGYVRIDDGLDDLLPQADPRDATDLLVDWETNLGLPDECIGQLPDLDSRRDFAFSRHTDDGGQDIPHLIARAKELGFVITIKERWQRQYGDAMSGGSYGSVDQNFTWEVHAPAVTRTFRMYGAALSGGPYSSWGNTALECELNKIKPAHTILIFIYGA